VVLVHGPFADASSWNGVIRRLRAEGREGGRSCESAQPQVVADVILETVAAA